jgi:carboxyl-terminal processing protease
MMRKLYGVLLTSALVLLISAFSIDYFEINKQLEIFTSIFKEVNLNYVDDTEPRVLMEKAVEGMLKNLDPFTVYIPESKIEDFRMMQTGQYGGIGSTIRKIGDKVLIAEPHPGFPADLAGLKAGDWIKAVDGKSLIGKSTEEVSEVLKGTPGTAVELVYERDGKAYTVQLQRKEIQLKSVPYYGMVNDNTGYIYLSSFTDKATDHVLEALNKLKKEPQLTQIILDLRGNPGGLLDQAVNITNFFVEKGTEVVRMKGRNKDVDRTYQTLRGAIDTEIPLAVLINGSSASASEIVAGSIQDLDRGVVLGQRSYGKGLVQQSHPLPYASQLKITIAKYYTPSGRCIQAINYADRSDDGAVARTADSLRTAFKTLNGRPVFDGGGIDPDITVEDETASGILVSLANNGHIFNFATVYTRTHDSIAMPGGFSLSDEDYQNFIDYLADKEYAYTTQTERSIAKLLRTAEDEEYADLLAQITTLENEAVRIKQNDLIRYKPQIKAYLEQEIVGRYYYQSGRIRQSLENDPTLDKAIEILNNTAAYHKILALEN